MGTCSPEQCPFCACPGAVAGPWPAVAVPGAGTVLRLPPAHGVTGGALRQCVGLEWLVPGRPGWSGEVVAEGSLASGGRWHQATTSLLGAEAQEVLCLLCASPVLGQSSLSPLSRCSDGSCALQTLLSY